MIRNWKKYRNGNYTVFIDLNDGTKIRALDDGETEFSPVFSEGCDILISNRCDRGCPYCYAGCTPDGIQPPIPRLDFEPYTEVAINLNFPRHPELLEFLEYQKQRNVIVNATVNQEDAIRHSIEIGMMQDLGLIKALGISYSGMGVQQVMEEGPNRILHVIAGLFSKEDHRYLQSSGTPPKLLILGYKYKHRGKSFLADRDNLNAYVKNMSWLTHNIEEIMESYPVVSFDNRALEDLMLERILDPEVYKSHYMGDEGEFTFTIDLVRRAYSASSQDYNTEYKPMGELTPTEMFQEIRSRR